MKGLLSLIGLFGILSVKITSITVTVNQAIANSKYVKSPVYSDITRDPSCRYWMAHWPGSRRVDKVIRKWL